MGYPLWDLQHGAASAGGAGSASASAMGKAGKGTGSFGEHPPVTGTGSQQTSWCCNPVLGMLPAAWQVSCTERVGLGSHTCHQLKPAVAVACSSEQALQRQQSHRRPMWRCGRNRRLGLRLAGSSIPSQQHHPGY